jgi:hypothetical protein
MLKELDSIEEVECAIADPAQFLRNLATASAPAAKKLAIMRLKQKLEPFLKKQGQEWADVVPMLEELDSIEEVEGAIADPEQFLRVSATVRKLRRVVAASEAEPTGVVAPQISNAAVSPSLEEPALSRNVYVLEDPGSVFDEEVLISVLPSGFGVCSVQGMATKQFWGWAVVGKIWAELAKPEADAMDLLHIQLHSGPGIAAGVYVFECDGSHASELCAAASKTRENQAPSPRQGPFTGGAIRLAPGPTVRVML